jgi:phosphoribosylformimino-5-aminoimidazole carboxamide ribotide isomerase
MFVIPAIELRDGGVARATIPPGAADRTLTGESPFELVRAWAGAGFRRIHITDLDARAGAGSNEALVDTLLRDGACELQIEACIDSADDIQRLVDAGAARVVLGPRALDDESWFANAVALFPGLLIVATDVRQRRVVKRGWVRTLPVDILDFVDELDGAPLGGLLIDSATAQAALGAIELSLLEDVAEATDVPIMIRGGVCDSADLRALEHRGVSAAVVGEPFYSGALDAWSVAREFG